MLDLKSTVLSNEVLHGPYHKVIFRAPEIASAAQPGQFVHIRISDGLEHVLRRPFSIASADGAAGTLTVVYKVVGAGTKELAGLPAGAECRVLGPLGTHYTFTDSTYPVIVAGGYGSASTLFLAQRCKRPGIIFMGARNESDLILLDEYRALGWQIEVATDDGSAGFHGLVTQRLAQFFGKLPMETKIFGCGPAPMLYALAKIVNAEGLTCEVSMDQHMGCGVGACFACVIKVKDASNADGWRYSRSCKEGVVYSSTEVYCG